MKFTLSLFVGAFTSFALAQDDDIPTTAVNAGVFGTLVAALGAADLVGALSEPNGPFTVFAPTDAAFAALPPALVPCLLDPANVAALTSILTYHVVVGEVFSTDLEDGMMPETLNTETISIDLSMGVMINGATTVVTPDIEASNGVIHVIDSVLVPPSIDVAAFLATCPSVETPAPAPELDDIPTTAVNAGSFGTLVDALGFANLVDALATPNGPFTVFAPTDDAFDALPAELVTCILKPENVDSLTSLLTYHVVEGTVMSTDLVDGMMPTTLNTETITVGLSMGVMINTATVVSADVMASNGVIHVIDSVLVPASFDVVAFLAGCAATEPTMATDAPMVPVDIPTTAVDAGIFGTLVAALGAAELVDTLAGAGPFTVFAPTDDAFDELPMGLVTCLLEPDNKDALTSILTYHVVAGTVLSTDLVDGMTPETLNTEMITIDLSDGVTINEVSNVVTADVMASNGVVHIIDSVLVPPSIDVAAFMEGCDNIVMSTPAPSSAAAVSAVGVLFATLIATLAF